MAKYSGWGLDLSFIAESDLSDYQWYFVTTAGSAGYVKRATGASAPIPIGVLQNNPRAGEEATVRVLGTTKVYANATAAIGYGDFVTSNSAGMAVVQSTASTPGAGIAMESLSSGSGVAIEVLLLPGMHVMADNTP